MSRFEIDKIKAKLEHFFANPDMSRVITHNNWGEYGHKHHKALNKAVRELAVKYRKDVWMLGCDNGAFVDVTVPSGITYTMGNFNDPDLYLGVRTIYENNGRWTWYTDRIPSGEHKFIKIVEAGVDKSNILTGESVTTSGSNQNEPGAYIFDGSDDYMALAGNNYASFTIAVRVRPNQIRAMDIAKMAEYPSSATHDRNLYLNADGRVTARIYDGSSKTVTSNTALTSGTWAHVAITSTGNNLKLYVNGALQNTISTGTAITSYSTPEFVIGQATLTGSFFDGQINDVRMYNRVLSDNEIADLSGMGYTITSSAGSGGTINPSGTINVMPGENRTFSITPNAGFQISDVKVDNISVGIVSSYTFTNVTTNHTISATFEPVTFTITANAGTGGSINPSGTITVSYGANQSFSITTNLGYQISDVKVDDISVGQVTSYTFNNITASHSIVVTFISIPTYTITSSAGLGGSINPVGEVTVNLGANQTYSIIANTGYKISDVLVDNISVGTPSSYTFSNITANHTISVTYEVIPTYTIVVSAGSGGSITPSGTLIISEGSNQTFAINANTGYKITDVLVDGSSIGTVTTYTFNNVIANHAISAVFEIITYTITASAGTGGSINPAGTITADHGTNRSFTITPGTGYMISEVRVDNTPVGTPSSYTFNNITANHTISVTFAVLTYTISASSGTGGNISPQGEVIANYGTNRTFTVTPNTGYNISDVKVNNVSVGAISTYTFNNIVANHTITASFVPITYLINASTGSNGTISPQGDVLVNHGSNRTFTISPNFGFQIAEVRVDNVSIGTGSTYTFNNITGNHTISASFSTATYTITSSAGTGGSISPSGIITLNHGSSRSYTITTDIGYRIADVRVDGISVGTVASYTFNNVTANHTITVAFELITYIVNASSGTGGTINPNGNVTVNYGTNRTFTITPNTGYYITDVRVDNNSVGPVSTYTFNNVTSDHTISATFSPITYTITSSAGAGGTINPQGEVLVNHGTNRTFTIAPNTGYQIQDVRVDNNSVGPVSTYSFNNITDNHTISVAFSIIGFEIISSSEAGGTINPAGTTIVNFGSNRTFTIVPEIGYQISDVRIDNVTAGPLSTFTFSNVTDNHAISATFRPVTYIITGSADVTGTISPHGKIEINHGTNQTYIITPWEGFQISDVFIDNISIGAVNSYTFDNITTDHLIFAAFSLIKHTITASPGMCGTISPAGSVKLSHGMNQTYTITSQPGFRISDVKIDSVSVGPLSDYTFNNVTSSHTISASFNLISLYTVTAGSGNGGTITPKGNVTVSEGTDKTYTIRPDKGFRISDVKIDNLSAGDVPEYTFENITSDHTIFVKFSSDVAVNIYPNPYRDYFILQIDSPDDYLFDMSIHNLRNNMVYFRGKIAGNTGITFTNPLPPGIYLLKLNWKGGSITRRVVRY